MLTNEPSSLKPPLAIVCFNLLLMEKNKSSNTVGRKSSQLDCFTAKCLFQSLPKKSEKSSGHCHFPSHRSSPAVFCPHRRRCKSALPCTRCHQTRLRQLGPQQRSRLETPAELNPHGRPQRLPQRSGHVQILAELTVLPVCNQTADFTFWYWIPF